MHDYFVANFREVIQMSRVSCVFLTCSVYAKIVTENEKKKIFYTKKTQICYTNLYLKDGLGMEFTAC